MRMGQAMRTGKRGQPTETRLKREQDQEKEEQYGINNLTKF